MTIQQLIDKLNKIPNKNEINVAIHAAIEMEAREIEFIYYDDQLNTVIISDDPEDEWELDTLDVKL